MQRRRILRGFTGLLAGGLGGMGAAVGAPAEMRAALTPNEAVAGIRTALERGAASAVDLLGRTDGFLANPQVRIPLPPAVEQVAQMVQLLGPQRRIDALVVAMNRAAEAAVPEARRLLVQAVRQMSVEDALGVLRGGETSVTQFFSRKTHQPLTERFLPSVTQATQQVSLARKYNDLAGMAAVFGLVDAKEANLERWVTARALDGLYFMIGEEERRIRRDPFGTGSAILQKVFGRF